MKENHKITAFEQLKRGDRFAVSAGAFRNGGAGDNIKVNPAMLCDSPLSNNIPFNAINLLDGRVRTFHDNEQVLVRIES